MTIHICLRILIHHLGEAFPTRYRSTAHGIAASAGKLGAILAQLAFTKLKDRGGKNKAISHMYV